MRDELKQRIALIVPLQQHEIDFINQIRNRGQIKPELITTDTKLAENIKVQPALQWVIKKL